MPEHHRRLTVILELFAVAALAALAGAVLGSRVATAAPSDSRRRDGNHRGSARPGLAAISPHVAESTSSGEACDYVRPAGPDAMRDAPRRGWDEVDEASDESFPASDATARY